MFSDPIANEWISGVVAVVFCGLAVLGVSWLMAVIVIKIWGDEDALVSDAREEAEPSRGWTAPSKMSA
jgi:hypothetical protein